jgi:integrase/recombinase XerD
MVPIADRAIGWIERYLQQTRPRLVMPPDEGILFLTNLGESITPSRLTQLVREYVNAAELEKRGACHLFRHTMATLMLEGGADIRYIQEMLGHVELSTTQIYTQVSIKKLKAVHELTHPGAAKGQTAGRGHAERHQVETERATGAVNEAAAEQLFLALDADREEEEGDEDSPQTCCPPTAARVWGPER